MNLLAIDTALGGISVGVQVGDQFAGRQIQTQREQASLLVPTIQEILKELSIDYSVLEAIACTVGPGSFTGLRIGLSTAKSFALALNLPTIAMGTLDLMACHYQENKSLLVVLETKRQDFYAQYYKNGVAVGEPMATSAEEILKAAPFDDFKIGGDCLERFKKEISSSRRRSGSLSREDSGLRRNDSALFLFDNLTQPDPKTMIDYAQSLKEGPLNPVYLRGADVSQSKTKPRKLVTSS